MARSPPLTPHLPRRHNPRSLNGFALRRNAAGMAAHALLSVNLDSLRWQDLSGEVPADMAETHRASALVGGRHAFLVAGQVRGWMGG